MFSKTGTLELHAAMHERLDLLLRHVAAVPDDLQHRVISGFGHPSIWKQLVHILTCEEGWVHDLQNKGITRYTTGRERGYRGIRLRRSLDELDQPSRDSRL